MFDRSKLSFIALALAAQCGVAQAQDAPAPDASSQPRVSDEIVVTAQRRQERLQDVPIAITAVSAQMMENQSAVDMSDLLGAVPSLNITTSAGQNSTNLVSLRGIAGQPLTIGASQATAVYLDGVYLTKPDAAFFGLDDIERIEVLRGPQGTLYGRNATAGAINIITRTPGQSVGGRISGTYGNYDAYTVRGSVDLPLGGGFSLGLSGSADAHEGYFVNTATGSRFGEHDAFTGRAKLHYDNGGSFDATLAVDYSNTEGEDVWKEVTTNSGATFVGIGDAESVVSNLQGPAETSVESGGAAFTANFQVSSSFVLTSITSWRTFEFQTYYDLDASTRTFAHSLMLNTSDTFNQEVRGVYTGDRLRLTAGVNYFHDSADYRLRSLPPVATIPALIADSRPHDVSDLDAVAVFAQGEYDVTDTLTAVVGLRYNHESRDFVIDYSAQGTPATPFPPIIGELSDDAVLPAFGLNWKVAPDILIYAKASKGYQAPGFNFLPGAGAPQNTFDAESLWAYEAGFKSQLFDRRLTLNAAGFYYDYSDVQVRTLISQLITRVVNAASASVEGFEAELSFRPVEGLTLSAHTTYSNAVYEEFCDGIAATQPQGSDPLCAPGRADRTGNALNQAPKWTSGASIAYTAPLGDNMALNLYAAYSRESNSFFTPVNEIALSTGGWERLDARAGIDLTDQLEIFAFGRNLTDERYIGYAIRIPTVISATISDPLTYGVGAQYRF